MCTGGSGDGPVMLWHVSLICLRPGLSRRGLSVGAWAKGVGESMGQGGWGEHGLKGWARAWARGLEACVRCGVPSVSQRWEHGSEVRSKTQGCVGRDHGSEKARQSEPQD